MAGVILCRAYFYQYQLGHISCIGWLEGRVAIVTSCTSTLGITHTRKDTKLGYVCREADNEASKYTAVYLAELKGLL